jgi:DnaJ-class molecular chaperone
VRWLEERGAYRLLGVEPSATEGQIKKCYHKLSLKAHPDKGESGASSQSCVKVVHNKEVHVITSEVAHLSKTTTIGHLLHP